MTIDVTVDCVIARPRGRVAAFLADPANDTRWIGGISEARMLSEPPFGPGSRVERVASFLGRRIDYVTEVTVYDPTALLVMRSLEGPFPMTIRYAFSDEGGGTKVELRNQGGPGGLLKLADPLMATMVRRSTRKDLARLKAVLESEPV